MPQHFLTDVKLHAIRHACWMDLSAALFQICVREDYLIGVND